MHLDTEFLQLPLLFDVDRLCDEVASLDTSAWRPHPQGYPGNSAAILISTEGGANDRVVPPMRPTPTLARCPYLRTVLASFGVPLGRTRLMRIAGEGSVPPHADVAYYWSRRVRIHVPIVTDPRVRFVCAERSVHMGAGEAWIFDNWRVHRVENRSPTARIHLVADTLGGPAFDDHVRRGRRPFGVESAFEPRSVPFDAGADPPFATETAPLPMLMPADEVARVLDFLSEETRRSPLDPADVATFTSELAAFVPRWREALTHSNTARARCESLLAELRESTARFEDRLPLTANGVDAVRVLKAHLFDPAIRVETDVSHPSPGRVPTTRDVLDRLRRGDLDTAESLVEGLLADEPRHPDALHLAGIVALRRGHHAAAVERLRGACEADPDRAEFRGNLGVALLALGRPREGVAALEAAVGRNPGHAESHDNLGLALGGLGEHVRAVRHHQRAVELRPDFGAAWLHLGGARARVGDIEGAITAFERARASAPQRDEARRALVGLLERTGRFDEVLELAGRSVANGPESPADLGRRGVLLARSGDHASARGLFERVLAAEPGNVDAHNNLGTSLAAEGRYAAAADRFERAVAGDSGFADGWANLGRARTRLGDHAGAIEAWRRCAALRPEDAVAHEQLGLAGERVDDWEAARSAHGTALRLAESRPIAWMGLARCRDRLEDADGAVAAARRAVELTGSSSGAASAGGVSAEALHLLGTLLARRALDRNRARTVSEVRRTLAEAVEVLRGANALEPRARAYDVLGAALYRLDRFDESRAALERAVELDPELAETLDALGTAELDDGRFESAADRFRRALAVKPTLGRAHLHLLRAERNRTDEGRRSRLATIAGLLARPTGLSNNDRVHLHVAAGVLHEELREYDEAFVQLERGNALKPRPPAATPFSEIVDRTIAAFSGKFPASHAHQEGDSSVPILVVGMPRSGTTLVEQILASHPRIAGAGELKELGLIADGTTESFEPRDRYPECVPRLDERTLSGLADRYLAVLESHRGRAERVTDKMPTNFLHLGLAALLFPRATVIRCVRDPRDVCVSCFRQNLDWPFCDLAELGRYHRAYERLMDHWRDVLPLTVHEVVYEDLVADLDTHAQRLVAACGVEWDERCLRFHETERAVRTPSRSQVRRPVYGSSVGRWRVYERHLGPLLEALEHG